MFEEGSEDLPNVGLSFLSEDFAVLQRPHMGDDPQLQGLPEILAVTLLWFFLFVIAHKSRVCWVSMYQIPYLHLSLTPELPYLSS